MKANVCGACIMYFGWAVKIKILRYSGWNDVGSSECVTYGHGGRREIIVIISVFDILLLFSFQIDHYEWMNGILLSISCIPLKASITMCPTVQRVTYTTIQYYIAGKYPFQYWNIHERHHLHLLRSSWRMWCHQKVSKYIFALWFILIFDALSARVIASMWVF